MLGRLLDWLKRSCVLAFRKVRDWWREILAFVTPFLVLAVLVWAPDIPAALHAEASIGTIAAVQGAVTGLSLIALVLAVELARRQEDRDDTVYEIMLRSAGIRPAFVFAIAALLATLIAIAISDFSVVGNAMLSANLLLPAYVLTGAVGIALLLTVLRTVQGLKPTGILEFRLRANEEQRRERVDQFLSEVLNDSRTIGDITLTDAIAELMRQHAPVPLTASERLFVEVDDALASARASRFAGALERLQALIENSADQIESSSLPFSPPGQPEYGYWFPLDALRDRIYELWRAAFARQGDQFADEMRSLELWLVSNGVKRRSGELLELGLLCGRQGYAAAVHDGTSARHAEEEWVDLKVAAFWPLRGNRETVLDSMSQAFAERLIEYLQEYGNMLLRNGDVESFQTMLSQFAESFLSDEKLTSRPARPTQTNNDPLTLLEYSSLALLALAGRVIELSGSGKITDANVYLDAVYEQIENTANVTRLVPAACRRETRLYREWSLWDMDDEQWQSGTRLRAASEHYVMLGLLAQLLRSGARKPLPSLDGYARRLTGAWEAYREPLLDVSEIDDGSREEVAKSFGELVASAEKAEQREQEDFHIAAPLDQNRVAEYLAGLKAQREGDRVVQSAFEHASRLRHVSEAESQSVDPFVLDCPIHRNAFTTGTNVQAMRTFNLVLGFEGRVFRELRDSVTGAPTNELPGDLDLGPVHIDCSAS